MSWRLQPHVLKAATLRVGGCNPMCWRLQPYMHAGEQWEGLKSLDEAGERRPWTARGHFSHHALTLPLTQTLSLTLALTLTRRVTTSAITPSRGRGAHAPTTTARC